MINLKFKNVMVSMSIAFQLLFSLSAGAVLNDRVPMINFQGSIMDEAGHAFDGNVKVEVRLYSSTEKLPVNLVYAEEFLKIRVEHGIFNVPIFSGMPLDGTTANIDNLVKHGELYANLAVDGTVFIENWPFGSSLSAIRAERVKSAEILTGELQISSDQIPAHEATKLTSGKLADSTIPQIPAANISGQFKSSQIPNNLDAGKLTGKTFLQNAFDTGLSADRFTVSTLADNLVSSDVIRKGTIKVKSGFAAHGTKIGLPDGSSISDCKWTVTLKTFNEDVLFDAGIDYILVNTDSNGIVNCSWSDRSEDGYNEQCTANYTVICSK